MGARPWSRLRGCSWMMDLAMSSRAKARKRALRQAVWKVSAMRAPALAEPPREAHSGATRYAHVLMYLYHAACHGLQARGHILCEHDLTQSQHRLLT